ncbi:MAG: DNA recombination protein RmuC [Kiritimatiellae bacterium]|jgi:DNA recombination protein RmuC|nr:DNA recombination protein RmuC [Kiritimatiellia bacterium]
MWNIVIICLLVLIVVLLALLLMRKAASGDDINKLEEALRQELSRQQSSQSNEARGLREEAVQQRRELAEAHSRLADTQGKQLESVRGTLAESLEKMRGENAVKLEEMRCTVDEKLHNTLEKRLGESFEQVSKRLEDVARGLGEMQQLATGVGDLKRVLTNVKARGTWGEYQLEAILAETLTVDQYGRNVKTNPQTRDLVEFAIKLPGRDDDRAPVWLPIDSKFPKEDYERLQLAVESADKAGADVALRQLERRVKDSAREICKYLAPPHTTDFAIMFLPIEGLYAEILRCPGLVDEIQRDFRITIAGPTTLTALLNSLQMGFRTLAIEKRSSEVWQVLAAVKSEFMKFGSVFEKVQRKIEDADKILKSAEIRTRAMTRKLRSVEDLPESLSAEKVLEE